MAQPTQPQGERRGQSAEYTRPVIESRRTRIVTRSKMSDDLLTEVMEIAVASTPPSIASIEQRGVQSDTLPMKAFYPKPIYPLELEARGIGGLVKLRVRVGADGKVKAASVFRTSGYRAFDRAALVVIDRWRFEPARRAGIRVEIAVLVPIRFKIERP